MKVILSKFLLIVVMIMLFTSKAYPQDPPPPFSPGDSEPNDVPVHIPALVAFGLIAGSVYGIRKMRR